MPTYIIKYHVLPKKGCCGRKPKSGTFKTEASSEEEAKSKLRQIVPGARFEKVEEAPVV